MTALGALLAGYLIGSLPTAGWLGSLAGVDLRNSGSGNPGANNALRVGGPLLGASVLFVEMAKGVGAVLLGSTLGGDPGAVAAGLSAVAGNVYNVWYGFEGGKGLGITAGVLLAAWPVVFLPALALIALVAVLTQSSGAAAIVAVVGLVVAALLWLRFELPVGWGVEKRSLLLLLAVTAGAIVWPRHWAEASFRRPSPG